MYNLLLTILVILSAIIGKMARWQKGPALSTLFLSPGFNTRMESHLRAQRILSVSVRSASRVWRAGNRRHARRNSQKRYGLISGGPENIWTTCSGGHAQLSPTWSDPGS